MESKTTKPNRRSIRLAGYDYGTKGAYIVTVCADRKRPVFGRIVEDELKPNAYGSIVAECWMALPEHFGHVELDEWVVMPNHLHGIIVFHEDAILPAGTPEASPYNESNARKFGGSQSGSLSVVIGQFKMHVTRAINKYRLDRELSPVVVWQRNFYERIIRDEKELDQTRRYIAENPQHWGKDSENSHTDETP